MKSNAKIITHAVRSILLAGVASTAFAQLQDRGPADPVLVYPQWYRDTGGTPVGLCKSQQPSPNAAAGGATMCFPIAPNPAGFAGNVGDEIFYNMVEFKQKPGADVGFNFRYLAALEASYLPGPTPVHGQEAVFARVRIAFNFNNPAMNGNYTVTHPFGVEHFENVQATDSKVVQGSQAAVYFTLDVPLAANAFDEALQGPVGPFIRWDALQPGESLTVGNDRFLGDPNYPHTFTGSPFGTNYLRIDGPPGSGIGADPDTGLPVDYIEIHEANVLGQLWTAPIATPTSVISAKYSRSNATGLNAVDVWAKSDAGQKLLLTGASMPSMQMVEDGIIKGKYHGHIEYPSSTPVPAQVTVTNASSNPVVSASAPLTDIVEISKASYDTSSRVLSVVAKSSDEVSIPTLIVENVPGVSSATQSNQLSAAACPPGTPANDMCFSHTVPANVEVPEEVKVRSSTLGGHADSLVMLAGVTQHISPAPFAGEMTFSVNTSGASQLPGLPANAVVVTQPNSGTITGGVFTAKAGALQGNDSFTYVVQDPASLAVSNVATGRLNLVFSPSAPTANLDQVGVRNNNVNRVLNILANDQAATPDALNQIDPATIQVVGVSNARLVVTVGTGANSIPVGQVAVRTAIANVTDSFTYRVKNKAGQFSAPATVQVTSFAAAEALPAYTKLNYKGSWVITGATNWFGPNLGQTIAACYLTTSGGRALAPQQFIASGPVDATGKFQVVGTAPAAVSTASVTCQTFQSGTPGALRAGAVTFQ